LREEIEVRIFLLLAVSRVAAERGANRVDAGVECVPCVVKSVDIG
jgi:hypothetical protein